MTKYDSLSPTEAYVEGMIPNACDTITVWCDEHPDGRVRVATYSRVASGSLEWAAADPLHRRLATTGGRTPGGRRYVTTALVCTAHAARNRKPISFSGEGALMHFLNLASFTGRADWTLDEVRAVRKHWATGGRV